MEERQGERPPPGPEKPLWTDIGIVGGNGKPAWELPLQDGYFEVTLPRGFLESTPKSVTLNWIDFYRE